MFGGLSGGLHILYHIVINNSLHYVEDHEELLATYGNPVINQGIFYDTLALCLVSIRESTG